MPEHHANGSITPETTIKATLGQAVAYIVLLASIIGSYFHASYRIQRLEEKVTEARTSYVSRVEMDLIVMPLKQRIAELEEEKYLNDIERYGRQSGRSRTERGR